MAASGRFRLPPPLPVLLVVCLGLVPPAEAQHLVYSTRGLPPVHGRIDLSTGADTPLAESAIGVYTSDGQFGLRQEGGRLRVWHVPTGAQTSIAIDFIPRTAHPRAAAIFGVSAGRPARLDATGVHVFPACAPVQPTASLVMDVSGDGRTLVQLCGTDLVSIDTTTGMEIHRLANAGIEGRFALNHDGSDVTAWQSPALPATLVRLRLADGQVLAQRIVNVAANGAGVQPTPDRRRAVMSSCALVGPNVDCSAVLVTVADLSSVRALGSSNWAPPAVTVSPDGRDAFIRGLGYAVATTFTYWLDVETGAIRASYSAPIGQGVLEITYLPAPLPPVLASAAVAGGVVSLSWTLQDASPTANGYRLEAGYGPGATAVSLDLGAAAAVTIPGVPPGRYYARLRAVNYNGVSAASNEVVIDVP
jgi:hypothetical protein